MEREHVIGLAVLAMLGLMLAYAVSDLYQAGEQQAAWEQAHPCIKKSVKTCQAVSCIQFDGNGQCVIWMPSDYDCGECLERKK